MSVLEKINYNNIQKGGMMTQNQIEYWRLQESHRSNRANEVETNRHNIATESETNRNNSLVHALGRAQLAETNRSNIAKETQNAINQMEVARHNRAMEQQQDRQLLINQQDADTRRYSALASATNGAISNLNDSVRNMQNYDLGIKNLAETIRSHKQNETLGLAQLSESQLHNRVTESETSRHNTATEQETHRHNVADESTKSLESKIKLHDSIAGKLVTFAKLLVNNGVRKGLGL